MPGSVYHAPEDLTYWLLAGDTWRYRDLVAEGGTAFDAAWMDPEYDDSSWLNGPSPFRNGYTIGGPTVDEFGEVSGTPDIPGTNVLANPITGRISVAARIAFTVPSGLNWDLILTCTGQLDVWVNGVETAVLGESFFIARTTTILGPLSGGSYVIGMHGSDIGANGSGGPLGALVSTSFASLHAYVPPPLVALPDSAYVAEIRSEARLIPGIRMDGG